MLLFFAEKAQVLLTNERMHYVLYYVLYTYYIYINTEESTAYLVAYFVAKQLANVKPWHVLSEWKRSHHF